jgi:hypothetical protein
LKICRKFHWNSWTYCGIPGIPMEFWNSIEVILGLLEGEIIEISHLAVIPRFFLRNSTIIFKNSNGIFCKFSRNSKNNSNTNPSNSKELQNRSFCNPNIYLSFEKF